MHLAYGADGTVLDPLAKSPDRIVGMPLITQLGNNLEFAGSVHQGTHFANRVRQRLFAINMFAHPHGPHGNDGVGVVGCAYNHGIDLLVHRIEHFAKIAMLLRIGELGETLGGVFGIHIAKSDHVLAGAGFDVRPPLPADADPGNVELVIGGSRATQAKDIAGHDGNGCHCGRGVP